MTLKLHFPAIISFIFVFFNCQILLAQGDIEHKIVSSDYGELNANAPKETLQFGQLVGTWQCVSLDIMPDSSWHESKALWTFKYTLDGFAIEDIWMEKEKDKTNNTLNLGRDFYGKNLRIYNPAKNKWQCIWIENKNNSISPVWEAYENPEGELIMHDGTGTWKIVFYNITPSTFDWKYEVLQQGNWVSTSKIKAEKAG